MSFEDFERKVAEHKPAAAMVVHIGGHIAFDIDRIVELCRAEGIVLLEDCAHAHGASWNDRKPGTFGDAGLWSFAPTKTISTGEGGLLVSRNDDLIEFARVVPQLRQARLRDGRAQLPDERVHGRARDPRHRAARGDRRLEEPRRAQRARPDVHPGRIELPDGMVSGLYKYIVFQPLERSTGKVYDQPCHRVLGHAVDLPNTDWVAENHWCAPLYYRPAALPALQAVGG